MCQEPGSPCCETAPAYRAPGPFIQSFLEGTKSNFCLVQAEKVPSTLHAQGCALLNPQINTDPLSIATWADQDQKTTTHKPKFGDGEL